MEVLEGDPTMPAIQPPGEAAEDAAGPGRDVEGERLEKCDDEVSDASEEGAHEKASVWPACQRGFWKRPESMTVQ